MKNTRLIAASFFYLAGVFGASAAPIYELGFDSERFDPRMEVVGKAGEMVTEISGREGTKAYKFTVGTEAKKLSLKEVEKANVAYVSALKAVRVNSATNIEGKTRWYGFSLFVPHKFVGDASAEDVFFAFDSDKRLSGEALPFSLGIQGGSVVVGLVGGSKGEVVTGYTKKENPPNINAKNKKLYEIIAGKGGLQTFMYDKKTDIQYIARGRKAVAKIKPGAWHDFVVYTKTGLERDGFVYVYLNNKKIFDYKGAIGLQEDDDMYVAFGLWRNKWADKEAYIKDAKRGLITRSLYIDSFRTGGALSKFTDVMPGIGPRDAARDDQIAYKIDANLVLPRRPMTIEELEKYTPPFARKVLVEAGILPENRSKIEVVKEKVVDSVKSYLKQ